MMSDLQQEKKAAYLVLPVISGVCWGTSGIFVRYLRDAGFDNITIIFSKGLVAAAGLLLYHEILSWIGCIGMVVTVAALIILIRSDQK